MSERQMRRARERQVEREAKCHGRLAKRGALGAGAALGATVVFAPAAQAANFPVTKLADTNDGTCDADCSLREAVYAANASTASDPDLVTFQSGLSGRIELAASFGDIRIEDGVTIQGPGADVIEVDGNRYDRIFYLDTASPDATTISGLTLLSGAGGYNNNGGALYAASGSGPLAIADSAIRFSYVYGFASDGGAISANNDSLTVTGSEFLGNDAGRSGGALFASTDVTITGSTLTGNDTFYGDGGAIYLDEGSLSVISSRISENQAEESGGGVYVDDTSPADATGVLLRDSVIDRNVAGDD
ncbi:MAG: CSLREA domain-containing protein, partial [Solirubrobacterales bacterium]